MARRHDASPRNRRKTLHHANCLLDELLALQSEASKSLDGFRYAIGRACRIINRLESEVEADE